MDIHWLNQLLFTRLPGFRQILTRATYEYLSVIDKDQNALFMNYGYAGLDNDASHLKLSPEEEKYRYEIQLYHQVATEINCSGLDVLEVSSGRGGGAAYISQHLHPKSYVGVDFSHQAVRFCNKHYSIPGLSFVYGNAESLHFSDHSFDVVINVEASFYYPEVERFFNHVVRILRPGGYFLYADMRYTEELETWRKQLQNTKLELLCEKDITPNVLKALDLDRECRIEIVKRYAPSLLHKSFTDFAGVTGANLATSEAKIGKRTYWRYIFRKN